MACSHRWSTDFRSGICRCHHLDPFLCIIQIYQDFCSIHRNSHNETSAEHQPVFFIPHKCIKIAFPGDLYIELFVCGKQNVFNFILRASCRECCGGRFIFLGFLSELFKINILQFCCKILKCISDLPIVADCLVN